jgi:methylated-DNA-[protein]-cysteine S-methyltransferase
MLSYCLVATAFGPVGLAWSERGIVRLQLPGGDVAATRERLTRNADGVETHPPEWLQPTFTRLQRYFGGAEIAFPDAPLDLEAVPRFNRQLYTEMLKLGWGETVTYGELAERAGAPGAAQAVGRAMGQNPIPVIIPCHRVLASGNKAGGFSAPGGVSTKLKLLAMERVHLGTARNQMAFAF